MKNTIKKEAHFDSPPRIGSEKKKNSEGMRRM